jgi:VIT1/CCC1 family predicted Fe2+/Mn2+ transporter
MVKDALDTHAREELGLTDTNSARPLQAAVFSALSFSAGATLPLVVAWLSPATLVFLFVILSSFFHWPLLAIYLQLSAEPLLSGRSAELLSGAPWRCFRRWE